MQLITGCINTVSATIASLRLTKHFLYQKQTSAVLDNGWNLRYAKTLVFRYSLRNIVWCQVSRSLQLFLTEGYRFWQL